MIIIIEPIVGTQEYDEYHMGKWRDLAREAINRGLKETGYDRILRVEEVTIL